MGLKIVMHSCYKHSTVSLFQSYRGQDTNNRSNNSEQRSQAHEIMIISIHNATKGQQNGIVRI